MGESKLLKRLPTPLQALAMVVRLRTIPIPTIQVLVGTGVAYGLTKEFNLAAALFTWLIAVFITIGTNIMNDVFDYDRGGDPLTRFGHRKVIRTGLLTRNQVYIAGMTSFALAIACSIPLAFYSSWIFIPITVLAALCGYCYTGGPYPICYNGLSELFIVVFYGGVCVLSAFYVQARWIAPEAILCSLQLGFLAVIPAAVNNLRDMFEDAEVNKRTLAVRFGKKFARMEITLATGLPFGLNAGWLFFGYPAAAFLHFLLTPLAFLFIRSIWTTEPGPIFNRYFGLSVLLHFLFGLLLTLGTFF
jgi:1,4-dihydroxy-2-naphthoate polyprenyltransferase